MTSSSVALGEISRNEKLDAVVQNAPDQPVAVSGCIDITDKAIEKIEKSVEAKTKEIMTV